MRVLSVSCIPVLMLALLAAETPLHHDQPAPARVVVVGSIQFPTDKKAGEDVVYISKSPPIVVEPTEEAPVFTKKHIFDLSELTAKTIKELGKLGREKQYEEMKRVAKEHEKKVLEGLKRFTAEGQLSVKDKEIVISGHARLYDSEGKERGLSEGTAMVEGEVIKGNYDLGGDRKSNVAISNGDHPIIITGTGAKAAASAQGRLRVTGRLGLTSQGQVYIDARGVQALKK